MFCMFTYIVWTKFWFKLKKIKSLKKKMVRTTRRQTSRRKKVVLLAAALAGLAAFQKREKLKKAVALALGYSPSLPPPPPPTPLEEMYDALQHITLFPGGKNDELENKIRTFLETKEEADLIRSFKTFKVTQAELDAFKETDECALDPARELMMKQLVNDRRLVNYYAQPEKLNLPFVFVGLQLHGAMITSEVEKGVVEFETYTVPEGCSVTIVYLTTPGLLHVDNPDYISTMLLEKCETFIEKHTALSALDLTRIISYTGKQYHTWANSMRQRHTKENIVDPEQVERTAKYSECVTLTYFGGESFLNKSFNASSPPDPLETFRTKNRHSFNISWTEKVNSTIKGPFFKANGVDNIDVIKTSELLNETIFRGEQKNVVIVDGSCWFIQHGLSPEATIDNLPLFSENYIKYLIQKCQKHYVAGGSN